MALFDMLVHDTLLTSWQDHVLAPSLYFRTRDKDTFGSSDLDKEAKQRKKDDLAAARIDRPPSRARNGRKVQGRRDASRSLTAVAAHEKRAATIPVAARIG